MNSLISLAAHECRVPEDWVREVIRQGPSRVKLIRIAKKNSKKYRYISRPSSELEVLQRWLVLRFFDNLPVHRSAMAFRKNHSVLTNARVHQKSSYFVRLDFRDFFPSVKFNDFIFALRNSEKCRFLLSEYSDAERFIERVCFDSNHALPIGYISSPSISNAVLYSFDKNLEEILLRERDQLGEAVITRYADDIVFSTNLRGGCKAFHKILADLLAVWASPKIALNVEKTAFSSKAGGSAMVTGLRICNDGHITIHRKHKDSIRLMLSLLAKDSLDPKDVSVLRGHLAYVQHVAPAFFSNICAKYPALIAQLLHGSR